MLPLCLHVLPPKLSFIKLFLTVDIHKSKISHISTSNPKIITSTNSTQSTSANRININIHDVYYNKFSFFSRLFFCIKFVTRNQKLITVLRKVDCILLTILRILLKWYYKKKQEKERLFYIFLVLNPFSIIPKISLVF